VTKHRGSPSHFAGTCGVEWIRVLSMRFRAAISTVMSVVLLVSSCVALGCQISCDLKMYGSSCHHAGAFHAAHRQADHQMTGMRHCGMESAGSSAVQSLTCGVVYANSCTHFACEQQPQNFTTGSDGIATQFMATQPGVLVAFPTSPVADRPSQWQAHETPPFRAPLLVSLQSIIRV